MFHQRVLLGWINDVSSQPRIGQRWPIIDADEQLLKDYTELFPVLKEWGYTGIAIWGLYINHAWPVDLRSCVTPERKRFVDTLIARAHQQGIHVYSGSGVYSWGFEDIIRGYPETAKNEGRIAWGTHWPDNGVVMCYHSEAARAWMRKVIDFVFESADVDGIGMQSADQGRCYCAQCRQMGDMEYHAAVNAESAAYIKERWPDKTVAVSGWGMSFDKAEDLPHLRKMGRQLDYLVDVLDHAQQRGSEYRQTLIQSLPCEFGSLGGSIFVPPQRWERFRWFLPHARLTGENLRELYRDGGRAFEFFAGPLLNPQHALMTRYVGYLLNHPAATTEQALGIVVDDLFAPGSTIVKEAIIQWLFDVEAAFFEQATPTHGEFDFEPLMGEQPGEPIYLDKLPNAYLAVYHKALKQFSDEIRKLARDCRKSRLIDDICLCLAAIQTDIETPGWINLRHPGYGGQAVPVVEQRLG